MSQTTRYYPEIDALRAIAVIVVIINHINKEILASGFIGVDIFFVISGFVITKTIIERGAKKPIPLLKDFYARRVKRIMPPLILYVTTMGLLTNMIGINDGDSIKTGIAALFGAGNIFLMTTSANYFNSDVELNAFTQTWSLGVEEQFYIIYPLIIISFFQWNREGIKKLKNIMIGLSIISVICALVMGQQNGAYYSIATRFWEMATGCILYMYKKKETQSKGWKIYILVALILGISFLNIEYYWIQIVMSVIVTAMLINEITKNKISRTVLDNKIMIYIGKISYSLYLWHWGLIVLAKSTIGVSHENIIWILCAIATVSIACYEIIEKRSGGINIAGRESRTIRYGVGATFLSGLIVGGAYITNDRLVIGDVDRTFEEIYSENIRWNREKCLYIKNRQKFDDFNKCWIDNNREANVKSIFAIGNSYNEQLVPGYIVVKDTINRIGAVNAAYTNNCDTVDIFEYDNNACNNEFNRYIDMVKREAKAGDLLMISFSLNELLGKEKGVWKKETDKIVERINEIRKNMEKLNVEVVMLSGIPQLKTNPDLCVQWYQEGRHDCYIPRILDGKSNLEIMKINKYIRKEFEGRYIDIYSPIIEILNNEERKGLVYYNISHITRRTSQQLGRQGVLN